MVLKENRLMLPLSLVNRLLIIKFLILHIEIMYCTEFDLIIVRPGLQK
jgi:hypothetical protein